MAHASEHAAPRRALALKRPREALPLAASQQIGDTLTGEPSAEGRVHPVLLQTLRATLAWSHDLLSERERILYRRLGVFAGSFGLPAVEGVCGGEEVPVEETLDASRLM